MLTSTLIWLVLFLGKSTDSVAVGTNNYIDKRRRVADAPDRRGFISIDCGGNDDPESLRRGYVSDGDYINTGKSITITSDNMDKIDEYGKEYQSVRSFANESKRNCYTFQTSVDGQPIFYLIRAVFMYGNYDKKNSIPMFDLYIGVNFWDKVSLKTNNDKKFYEIIFKPSTDNIYVCLVDIGAGAPFISTLVMRPIYNSIYNNSWTTDSLKTFMRYDFGSSSDSSPESLLGNEYDIGTLETDCPSCGYRSYDDDPYDRSWTSPKDTSSYSNITSTELISTDDNDEYEIPPSVLKTAITTHPGNLSLVYYRSVNHPSMEHQEYYVFWHFAEIQKHGENDFREFNVWLDGYIQNDDPLKLEYMKPQTLNSYGLTLGSDQQYFNFSIDQQSNASKLPPILNAVEIFSAMKITQNATHQDDVVAITSIKRDYTVPRSWQGDPCLPSVPWDGLKCSKNDHVSPRITSLNLTLSGLAGDIPHSLAALTGLSYLNLSYNILTGVIPDFLAQLPSLHTVDLRGNRLTGSIPVALSKKAEDGSINLRLEDNPDLCMSNPCKKKNSKNTVAISASIASITLIFTAIAVLVYILKRKKQAGIVKMEGRGFTYSEVMNMTNNFQTIIGKGGSGIVYHGSLQDGTLVAVKILNPSSTHSLKLFHTEAELLTRVHHRNLVSLIGYCEEGTIMALIYELVANGNLQQHLSAAEKDVQVLCWKERLQIAIDAAQGLEYLHSGCKPAIVHRDMKTSNILLDQNLHAKVSDFGISKSFNIENTETSLNTDVLGTHGYVDPEYYSTHRLNKKSDVYSFGVVLLELITGHPFVVRDNGEPIHLIAWTAPKLESGDIDNIVDKRLQGHFSTNSAWKALEIAMMCVSSTALQRPSMNQVLIDLNDCLAIDNSQGTNRETDNHGHAYLTLDFDHDIAIADTTIEMGPRAR